MASTASSLNNLFVQKLVTTVILAAAFFISAGLVIFLSLKGKEVTVPNLVGRSEGDAERLVEAEGLRLRVRNRTTDEKIQANLISDQIPNSGTSVKAGQVVNVTISTGIEARKEEAKATPRPTATPKPKPKPSPSPKAETDKEKDGAVPKPASETRKGTADKTATSKEPNKNVMDKAKATPSPKASPKPTSKPSPKKAVSN